MSPARRWATLLALLAMLGLLLSFDRVVRQAVVDGALRRAAVIERANAVWRCNGLPGRQARADCHGALS
ncbi:hypothetical protein RA210_U10067 [Rubrivivax sp. A210]|uniref:hypothetical protein n=1 Tax=Rubrivivax sp. A210 TaxID=2772301 RepID=UPI001919DCE2|nr:hypothetical protein [Rubrivivax sp. A210]CAD5365922.1 hypothetical protein RA210_U10067 [Rubrivivax sp. A210]